MIIDEQDIFTFVFFPEKLDDEKIKMIESQSIFSDATEFYKQLKLNSEKKPSEEIKTKLALKIPAYKLEYLVDLYPLKDIIPQIQNGSRMAAGAKVLTPKTSTKTFVDRDKEYLIKVVNYEEQTKVFVFSTKDEEVKNFDLMIEPKNLTFHFEDNSEPLVINHLIDAEKIQLKLR